MWSFSLLGGFELNASGGAAPTFGLAGLHAHVEGDSTHTHGKAQPVEGRHLVPHEERC